MDGRLEHHQLPRIKELHAGPQEMFENKTILDYASRKPTEEKSNIKGNSQPTQ